MKYFIRFQSGGFTILKYPLKSFSITPLRSVRVKILFRDLISEKNQEDICWLTFRSLDWGVSV